MQRNVNCNTNGPVKPMQAHIGLTPLQHQACLSAWICNLGRFPTEICRNSVRTTSVTEIRAAFFVKRSVLAAQLCLSLTALGNFTSAPSLQIPSIPSCISLAGHHPGSDAFMVIKQRWGRNIIKVLPCQSFDQGIFHMAPTFTVDWTLTNLDFWPLKIVPSSSCCGFKTHWRWRLCFPRRLQSKLLVNWVGGGEAASCRWQ